MLCDLKCDKRYKRWFICSSILFTYAAVERVEVISIPSNVAWVTRSMSGIGGEILRCLEAGRWKIISFVLSVLIVSLFLADQAQILSYSWIISTELCWPTSNVVSSAYLMITLWGIKLADLRHTLGKDRGRYRILVWCFAKRATNQRFARIKRQPEFCLTRCLLSRVRRWEI